MWLPRKGFWVGLLLALMLLLPLGGPTPASAAAQSRPTRAAQAGDTWLPVSTARAPSPRSGHTAVWTGREMLVWGGYGCGGVCGDGARYEPVTDTWRPLSAAGAPSPRAQHSAVWTGSELLIWAGNAGGPTFLGDGAAYSPASDTWRPLAAAGAPSPRGRHTAIWTGQEMLIWGGQAADGQRTGDAARYDPATDTWRPISTAGSPAPRAGHTAVWTGREMLVWGGCCYSDAGGGYDPVADAWRPVSAIGAPAGRTEHTAVWTGREMLVWGGLGGRGPLADGGRYEPAADAWTPLPTPGAPLPRSWHTAVWTDTEMTVWGGSNARAGHYGDGGRYNPTTNSWTPVPPVEAARARTDHTAVWTGSEMIVWGGAGSDGRPVSLGDGARYIPPAPAPAPVLKAPPLPHDTRYFTETGYRVDNDEIWAYFQARGGIETFGFPVSRTFPFLGCSVQIFQRQVAQRCAGGPGVQLLNLLDPEIFPYTRVNGSTFPGPDEGLKAATPKVGEPGYEERMLQFVREVAPDEFEGAQVSFQRTFFGLITPEMAGTDDPGILAMLNLQAWGAPTSRPARDPRNPNFVYQRFQRGILHFDASTGVTRGILLADYLKALMLGDQAGAYGANLPGDLRDQAQPSRYFNQYCPGGTRWQCRPADLPGTDLTVAFEPG